jgi:hypothetical protein
MFPSFIYYATNGKRKLLIIILHIVWYIRLYIRLHDVTDVDVINVFYHKKTTSDTETRFIGDRAETFVKGRKGKTLRNEYFVAINQFVMTPKLFIVMTPKLFIVMTST